MFSRALTRSLRTPRPQCLLRRAPLHTPLHIHRPQTRTLADSSSTRGVLSNTWNNHRYMALLSILFSATGISLALYGYTTYLTHPESPYPPPVTAELRKALYYSLPTSASPVDALRHFRLALERCAEAGLDPLSEEVTGIRIELAAMLLRGGMLERGVGVLEGVLDEIVLAAEGDGGGGGEGRKGLLRRGVSIARRIGEVYASRSRWSEAEEALSWAVETAIKESGKDDGGQWLESTEIAMLLENLASVYEVTDRFFLATPLYLLALEYMPAVNNLAACISQQPTPKDLPVSREQLVADSATPWALKALKLAGEIGPPYRTEECDTGCAVAMHNLAEFAEMLGDKDLARQRYREARSLAMAVGSEEGVGKAEEGLKRVGGGDV